MRHIASITAARPAKAATDVWCVLSVAYEQLTQCPEDSYCIWDPPNPFDKKCSMPQ